MYICVMSCLRILLSGMGEEMMSIYLYLYIFRGRRVPLRIEIEREREREVNDAVGKGERRCDISYRGDHLCLKLASLGPERGEIVMMY